MVRSSVLRLAFNTYKIIDGGNWKAVVFDKLAGAFEPAHGERSPSLVPRVSPGLPGVNRAILKKLAEDPRNVLVVQTPLDPQIRAEVDSIGIPIIDLGTYLENLRSAGQDPYYWPVTGMYGHWNHAAQPLIGRFLADQVAALDKL